VPFHRPRPRRGGAQCPQVTRCIFGIIVASLQIDEIAENSNRVVEPSLEVEQRDDIVRIFCIRERF
jgi:hypothetical protein